MQFIIVSLHLRVLLFHRCPSGIQTSKEASPRVVTSKLLGGVDQASLRLSLTSQAKMKASELQLNVQCMTKSRQYYYGSTPKALIIYLV